MSGERPMKVATIRSKPRTEAAFSDAWTDWQKVADADRMCPVAAATRLLQTANELVYSQPHLARKAADSIKESVLSPGLLKAADEILQAIKTHEASHGVEETAPEVPALA